jgi:prophage regulatory protein
MVQQLQTALVILRLKQILARTGLSRSFIYQKMAEGLFPESVRLGARTVGWIESEIEAWIAAQVEKSRKGSTVATKNATAVEAPEAVGSAISGAHDLDIASSIPRPRSSIPRAGPPSPSRRVPGSSKRRGQSDA